MYGLIIVALKRQKVFFATAPDAEAKRVGILVKDLHTPDQIIGSLGVPDSEETLLGGEKPAKQEHLTSVQVWTYVRLSKTVNVRFVIQRGEEIYIEVFVTPKFRNFDIADAGTGHA